MYLDRTNAPSLNYRFRGRFQPPQRFRISEAIEFIDSRSTSDTGEWNLVSILLTVPFVSKGSNLNLRVHQNRITPCSLFVTNMKSSPRGLHVSRMALSSSSGCMINSVWMASSRSRRQNTASPSKDNTIERGTIRGELRYVSHELVLLLDKPGNHCCSTTGLDHGI